MNRAKHGRGGMTNTELFKPSADEGRDLLARRIGWATTIGIALGAGILHFGREVFLPLAIATLIAFALSPLVSALRRRGLPRLAAVLVAVTIAFSCVGAILGVMASQISMVVESLPTYQANILSKLEALRAGGSSNVFGRLVDMMAQINAEIGNAFPTDQAASQQASGGAPVAVAVIENQNVWRMLQDILVPILSPLVTVGLILVVVIFVLLERDDLRDRFIRLTGTHDLHRTTEMLQDAGGRVASYLLIQILVNVIYAVPIGLGLWLIGVPNPILWALMTLVLRFVPYIGSVIAAAIPLFLAFAVSPDWSMVLWTAALFGLVEAITSNIIEPRLYGARTGLSPLAVIIAAIVWTWIWGPMGLILSTPLTVCLVVLGRYLPQFEVFDVLFGDEPALAAHARLYQRLLVGDSVESASRAEEALESDFLVDYYQSVGLPALLLAQSDYDRGVLTPAQEARIAGSAGQFVTALEPVVKEERAESDSAAGKGANVIVAGGRSNLDTVAARMLGQVLSVEGANVTTMGRADAMNWTLPPDGAPVPHCLVLCYLDPSPTRAALLMVRRIKRAVPDLRVGVVVWSMPEVIAQETGLTRVFAPPSPTALREADAIGADFVATSMEDALAMTLADVAVKPLPAPKKRPPRRATAAQTGAAKAVAG